MIAKHKLNVPLIYFVAFFIAAYFFFLQWETKTVYGDDLFIFNDHYALSSFSDQVNILIPYNKYRPVHGVLFNVLIDVFQKNTHYYYVFNVFVLALNFTVFALIVNLFLKSYFLSFLLGLGFGLSRFFLYFINQLLTGGASEGIALFFFLYGLYLVLCTIMPGNLTVRHKYRYLMAGILLANLNIYTLEKYIVVFVFLLFVVVFCQRFLQFTLKQRLALTSLAIVSPLLNVVIKKYAYSMPFFMGTGRTEMKFSASQAMGFMWDALVSVFQVNPAPEYLTGIRFAALPALERKLVYVFIGVVFIIFLVAIIKGYKALSSRISNSGVSLLHGLMGNRTFVVLVLLAALFFLSLMPAIATIRLEQRWLTAPFAIFLLMITVVLATLRFKAVVLKYSLVSFIVILLIWINNSYLSAGVKNTYMFDSERTAAYFKKALDSNLVHKTSSTLYLWGKVRDDNYENGMYWVLDSGNFFAFYGGKEKEILFVDSIYTKAGKTSFPSFDSSKDQIVFYWAGELKDVTDQYLTDSLKALVASYK